MHDYSFSLPTHVAFGAGTSESVGQYASQYGDRAILVTGSTFAKRSGLVDRVRASLVNSGVDVEIFDRLTPNPRIDAIDAAAAIARARSMNIVIGLGGGSAMDAAKAIAAAASSGRPIWEHAGLHDGTISTSIEAALPIVQVPIVASTGSETNEAAVVFDPESRTKSWLRNPHLFAKVAVVDPILTFTVPPAFTGIGGMNIISNMLETYLTEDEFQVTDRICEGLLQVAMESLPRAMQRGEDLEARTNLSWISAFGAAITSSSGTTFGPLRAMAQPLSAHFNIEYGAAVAALWPSYMRYALGNRSRLPHVGRFKRYALLGRRIFGVHETDDEVAARTTMYRFTNWLRTMNMPTDLRQLGVDTDAVGEPAAQAVRISGDGHKLPSGLTAEDVENIYEGALLMRS